MSKSEFESLKVEAGIRTNVELAEILGVKPGTISHWKGEPPSYVGVILKQRVEIERQKAMNVRLVQGGGLASAPANSIAGGKS